MIPAQMSFARHFTGTNHLQDRRHLPALDVDCPAGHSECFGPECRGHLRQLHDPANCLNRLIGLFRRHISGGSAFKTMKLFPQICVKLCFSRNMPMTMICPDIAG